MKIKNKDLRHGRLKGEYSLFHFNEDKKHMNDES